MQCNAVVTSLGKPECSKHVRENTNTLIEASWTARYLTDNGFIASLGQSETEIVSSYYTLPMLQVRLCVWCRGVNNVTLVVLLIYAQPPLGFTGNGQKNPVSSNSVFRNPFLMKKVWMKVNGQNSSN